MQVATDRWQRHADDRSRHHHHELRQRDDEDRERGIEVVEIKRSAVRDYSDLVRVTVECGEETVLVAGTLLGRRNRAHLLEVWGQRFNIQLDDHLTVFRYRDMPGMIGRVGSHFGEHGVNIVSAAVGRHADTVNVGEGLEAVMVITTDAAVPQSVIDEIVALDGFEAGRTVTL